MNIKYAAAAGQGGPVTVACVNKAKTPLGADFGKLTATLQKCYDQYFLPIWGYPLTLYNTDNPKPSDWQFIYFEMPTLRARSVITISRITASRSRKYSSRPRSTTNKA